MVGLPGRYGRPPRGSEPAGQRLSDGSERVEEVHLADGHRESGQRFVVVVFRGEGVELVGHLPTARRRLQDSFDQSERGAFGGAGMGVSRQVATAAIRSSPSPAARRFPA